MGGARPTTSKSSMHQTRDPRNRSWRDIMQDRKIYKPSSQQTSCGEGGTRNSQSKSQSSTNRTQQFPWASPVQTNGESSQPLPPITPLFEGPQQESPCPPVESSNSEAPLSRMQVDLEGIHRHVSEDVPAIASPTTILFDLNAAPLEGSEKGKLLSHYVIYPYSLLPKLPRRSQTSIIIRISPSSSLPT